MGNHVSTDAVPFSLEDIAFTQQETSKPTPYSPSPRGGGGGGDGGAMGLNSTASLANSSGSSVAVLPSEVVKCFEQVDHNLKAFRLFYRATLSPVPNSNAIGSSGACGAAGAAGANGSTAAQAPLSSCNLHAESQQTGSLVSSARRGSSTPGPSLSSTAIGATTTTTTSVPSSGVAGSAQGSASSGLNASLAGTRGPRGTPRGGYAASVTSSTADPIVSAHVQIEPFALNATPVRLRASDVYLLVHVQRVVTSSASSAGGGSASSRGVTPRSVRGGSTAATRAAAAQSPGAATGGRQREEDAERYGAERVPPWASQMCDAFTPRGMGVAFASDIGRPPVATYATASPSGSASPVLSARSPRSVPSSSAAADRSAGEFQYSIHLLTGKRAHPLTSAVAVLHALQIERRFADCPELVRRMFYNVNLARLPASAQFASSVAGIERNRVSQLLIVTRPAPIGQLQADNDVLLAAYGTGPAAGGMPGLPVSAVAPVIVYGAAPMQEMYARNAVLRLLHCVRAVTPRVWGLPPGGGSSVNGSVPGSARYPHGSSPRGGRREYESGAIGGAAPSGVSRDAGRLRRASITVVAREPTLQGPPALEIPKLRNSVLLSHRSRDSGRVVSSARALSSPTPPALPAGPRTPTETVLTSRPGEQAAEGERVKRGSPTPRRVNGVTLSPRLLSQSQPSPRQASPAAVPVALQRHSLSPRTGMPRASLASAATEDKPASARGTSASETADGHTPSPSPSPHGRTTRTIKLPPQASTRKVSKSERVVVGTHGASPRMRRPVEGGANAAPSAGERSQSLPDPADVRTAKPSTLANKQIAAQGGPVPSLSPRAAAHPGMAGLRLGELVAGTPGAATAAAAMAPDVADLEYDELRMSEDRVLRLKQASPEVTEVLPWLFVGGEEAARDKTQLLAKGITGVVNTVSFDLANYFEDVFEYLSLNVCDAPDEPIFSLFPVVNRFVEEVRVKNGATGKVFIHCHQGVSRSCSFVIAYIMWKRGMCYDRAYELVRSRRKVCSPNTGFYVNLHLWEDQLTQPVFNKAYGYVPYSSMSAFPFSFRLSIVFRRNASLAYDDDDARIINPYSQIVEENGTCSVDERVLYGFLFGERAAASASPSSAASKSMCLYTFCLCGRRCDPAVSERGQQEWLQFLRYNFYGGAAADSVNNKGETLHFTPLAPVESDVRGALASARESVGRPVSELRRVTLAENLKAAAQLVGRLMFAREGAAHTRSGSPAASSRGGTVTINEEHVERLDELYRHENLVFNFAMRMKVEATIAAGADNRKRAREEEIRRLRKSTRPGDAARGRTARSASSHSPSEDYGSARSVESANSSANEESRERLNGTRRPAPNTAAPSTNPTPLVSVNRALTTQPPQRPRTPDDDAGRVRHGPSDEDEVDSVLTGKPITSVLVLPYPFEDGAMNDRASAAFVGDESDGANDDNGDEIVLLDDLDKEQCYAVIVPDVASGPATSGDQCFLWVGEFSELTEQEVWEAFWRTIGVRSSVHDSALRDTVQDGEQEDEDGEEEVEELKSSSDGAAEAEKETGDNDGSDQDDDEREKESTAPVTCAVHVPGRAELPVVSVELTYDGREPDDLILAL